MTGPGLPAYGAVYSFAADSDLVSQIAYMSDSSTTVANTIRSFESTRDLITSIENKWGATSVSKYEYTNDALGRRTSVTVSGSAFNTTGTTGFDLYTYNDRNELATAKRYTGGTLETPTNPVYTRHFGYDYDPIGNRESYQIGQRTATTYTANQLNQYTATADPSASFTHDDDGNLTQDGTYTYVWDAENRLIEAYPTNPTTGSQKCVMVYDYMNRRVKRSLHDWTGSAWSGTPAESRVFLYDGWNVLLSYNPEASMAIDREFTWGLDLSGQNGNPSAAGIHGAGGIGGLVAARRVGSPTKQYFCFYDANGNLSDCLKNSDGTRWSHVEYDPYGGQIVTSDAGGLAHPFRYSTKYWDELFEKYYYGRRYLDYRQGRCLCRDPIEERADLHLSCFVRNAPSTLIDPVGLFVMVIVRRFYCTSLLDQAILLSKVTNPCTSELLNHFLTGGGAPLPCPASCQLAFENWLTHELGARGYAVGCPKNFNVVIQQPPGFTYAGPPRESDFAAAFGHFNLSLRTTCTTECCCAGTGPWTMYRGVRTRCYALTARAQDTYDFKRGAGGSGWISDLNDCAAWLQEWGWAHPFSVDCTTNKQLRSPCVYSSQGPPPGQGGPPNRLP